MTVVPGRLNTAKDLRTSFETRSRNQHDIDSTYQLLSDELTILLAQVNPQSNLSLDVSQTAQASATYLTPYSLPADWGLTKKIVVDIIPYYPIKFEERIGYRYSARHYYIDVKNKQFFLTGVVANGPKIINHWYFPGDQVFTEETEDEDLEALGIIPFPKQFWGLIVWGAIFTFLGGIDGEDVARQISQVQINTYSRLYDSFIAWCADQQLGQMGGRTGFAEEDDRPFDVGML